MSEVFRIDGSVNVDVSEVSRDLREVQEEVRETSSRLDGLDGESVSVDTSSAVSDLNRLEGATDEVADGIRAVDGESVRVNADDSEVEGLNDALRDTEEALGGVEGASRRTREGLGGVQTETERSRNSFSSFALVVADFASKIVTGAISKIKDLIGALLELPEATMEFRSQVAKLEGSTKQYGYSADETNKILKEMYGYLGDEQMAVNAISNLQGMKLSQSDLNAVLDSAVAVWSAYGDSIPIEGLTESINESAQVAQVTGSLADALNWAGISEDEFNNKLAECSSTQERARLITDTLNEAYSESKKTYDENTKSMREAQKAQFELTQRQAELAEKIEPLTTKFTQLKAIALEALLPVITAIVNAIQFLVNGFLSLDPTIQQIIIVFGSVVAVITTVVGTIALLVPIVQSVITTFSAFSGALTFLSGPVGLVIAAIGALIAIGVALYNNWDTIKAKASAFCKEVSEGWNQFKKDTAKAFKETGQEIANDWNIIKTTVSDAVNAVKTTVINVFNSIKAGITTVLNNIKTVMSNILKSISTAVTTYFNGYKTIITTSMKLIKALVTGDWNAIKNTISNAMNTAKSVVSSGLNAIKGFFSRCKLSFPKIALPHFSVSGKLSLNPPSVPKISVKWYAKGGIIDSPTLLGFTGNTAHIGGEAGPEAIVPLDSFYDKIGNMLEASRGYVVNINFNGDMKLNNQADMDKLAQTIDKKLQNFVNRNRRMKGDVSIV